MSARDRHRRHIPACDPAPVAVDGPSTIARASENGWPGLPVRTGGKSSINAWRGGVDQDDGVQRAGRFRHHLAIEEDQ
ncbi:hypothetical protein GCM10022380_18080 [Amycolatopsis tucumanensis]|uniref:Uncharacterized protein n=1 Tax=Amycolatopsis tucumanensis TaxID=401106 RepID=A0ABP7HP96_9PSEU